MNTVQRMGGLLLVLPLLVAACRQEELVVPSADEIQSYYTYSGRMEATLNGNVAELVVYQPTAQLRRGGSLWAKVGPYIFLFSNETRQLLEDYNGLAGVRVRTLAPGGRKVAEALLLRDALHDITWRRSLNISGLARRDGTEQPSRLSELVRWGEDHAEFEYNRQYTGR